MAISCRRCQKAKESRDGVTWLAVCLIDSIYLYTEEQALVFANIDYIMLTVRLLRKDYTHLARCLVPIGNRQIEMSIEEIAAMLKTKTRRFTEEEIKTKFAKAKG